MKTFEIETWACTNCHYQQDFESEVKLCPNCKEQDLAVSANKIKLKVREENDNELPIQVDEDGNERELTAQEIASIKTARKNKLAELRNHAKVREVQ